MAEPLRFSYAFQFPDGTKKEFAVIILSTQSGMVPTYVEDSLAEMEHLFRGYIER